MKTLTFIIDLTDDEITHTFEFLVASGKVSQDSVPEDAVYNFAKALQAEMYTNMASQVVDFKTKQFISDNTPKVKPKEIGGGVV